MSAIRSLADEGFNVTAFERRQRPGGVWSSQRDGPWTSALASTITLGTWFNGLLCGVALDRQFPVFLTTDALVRYHDTYITEFGLSKHLKYGCNVDKITRNSDDSKWQLHITTQDNLVIVQEFDKVYSCRGVFAKPRWPNLLDRPRFVGEVIHSMEYTRSVLVLVLVSMRKICDLDSRILTFATLVRRISWAGEY